MTNEWFVFNQLNMHTMAANGDGINVDVGGGTSNQNHHISKRFQLRKLIGYLAW